MEKYKIARFFECLLPVTICNLKCNYCYVIQREGRKMRKATLQHSPEHIGKCLTQKRLGGICYFSICGAGETLAQPEIIDIVNEILMQGHIVNITTNGTLTKRFKEFKKINKECLKRLHFSFSFHYNELKRLNLLNTFFENVNYIKSLGCSYIVQLNLCDEYIPYLDEIKKICMDNLKAYPQIAVTRKENKELSNIELYTDMTMENYIQLGNQFDSQLFTYGIKNFNKKREEFCYAGQRSGVLNLENGQLRKCYGDSSYQEIFKNPYKRIKFEPVGNNCYSSYCLNSTHFMALGVIDNDDQETYYSIRNRNVEGWFNETIKLFLNNKIDNKVQYSDIGKFLINEKERMKRNKYKIKMKIKNIIKKGIKNEKK